MVFSASVFSVVIYNQPGVDLNSDNSVCLWMTRGVKGRGRDKISVLKLLEKRG